MTDSAVPQPAAEAADRPGHAAARAACVLCGEPTEYPESVPGRTLCPVCEWQEVVNSQCTG